MDRRGSCVSGWCGNRGMQYIYRGAGRCQGGKRNYGRGWISGPVCFLTGNGGKQSDKAHKNGAGIHSAFPGCRTGNESRTDGGWRENCPDDRCPLSGKISYRPGSSFQNEIEHGDGKLTHYVWEIVDAAFDEIELLTPDVLIVSGDLTLNGEVKSHEEFAALLDEVERRGISVLVIPGNHDINSRWASSYIGKKREPVQTIDAGGFASIYAQFGYNEASERDPYSLSYTYDLSPSMRLLMLDTCQYSPVSKIGGMIGTETYEWIDRQLEKAREDGVILLPVGHHNLLDQSRVYTEDCTIEHSEELIERLEAENIPLFLSGHLHVQHFMRHEDGRGIYEIVTSSLTTPPCQYGVLEYRDDESFSYYTRQVDMEKWARRHQSTDENLINFNTYSKTALKNIFYNQAYDAMKNSRQEEKGDLFVKLTEEQKKAMAEVYSRMSTAWYAGKGYEAVKGAVEDPGFKMWQEFCYPAVLYEYLEYMTADSVRDYNKLQSE